jgi:dTDP-6-deoxy-L-talose 4-dehydrogenase (NAD+)
MRVSVTGASGFVGKHVLMALEKEDVTVSAFARTQSAAVQGLPVPVQSLDIANTGADLFERLNRPDILIHLAWGGLPNYNSDHHLDEELPRQQAFLRQAVTCGVKTLFVAGTCFEYGMQSGELAEETKPGITNAYGRAKQQLLQALQDLQQETEFNLIWGRLFYLYGKGQSPHSLWQQFNKACEEKQTIFNMSAGQQIRDFLPVEEAALLIAKLALSQRNVGAVNICSGNPVTVETLVRQWAEMLYWKGKLNLGYYPYPDYEPMSFWGDRRKLDRILGA